MLHIIFLNSRLKKIDMELLSNKYVTLFGLKNLNDPKKFSFMSPTECTSLNYIFTNDDLKKCNALLTTIYNKIKSIDPLIPEQTHLYFLSLSDLSVSPYHATFVIKFLYAIGFHIHILDIFFVDELNENDISVLLQTYAFHIGRSKETTPLIDFLLSLHYNSNISFKVLSDISGVNKNTIKYHYFKPNSFGASTGSAKKSNSLPSKNDITKITALRYGLTNDSYDNWRKYCERLQSFDL